MDVLIYGHRKTSTKMYDISTPEKELAAYLAVFYELDDFTVYNDLDAIPDLTGPCKACVADLHDKCYIHSCECVASPECKRRTNNQIRNLRQLRTWKKWCEEARQGNAESARKLVKDRSNRQYEYETVDLGTVIDPLEAKRASQTA